MKPQRGGRQRGKVSMAMVYESANSADANAKKCTENGMGLLTRFESIDDFASKVDDCKGKGKEE